VYSEEFVPEDEVLLRARDRAAELGCPTVLPGVGAVLQVLAASLAARAVVEIGTGTGVASLWLLRGMPADGYYATLGAMLVLALFLAPWASAAALRIALD